MGHNYNINGNGFNGERECNTREVCTLYVKAVVKRLCCISFIFQHVLIMIVQLTSRKIYVNLALILIRGSMKLIS